MPNVWKDIINLIIVQGTVFKQDEDWQRQEITLVKSKKFEGNICIWQ